MTTTTITTDAAKLTPAVRMLWMDAEFATEAAAAAIALAAVRLRLNPLDTTCWERAELALIHATGVRR